MEKVKEVVHKVTHPGEAKHTDTTHTGTHTTGTHTTGTHTTGTHNTTGTHTGHGVTGTSGTAGPHSSNLANKADPRVDSDLDGSRNAGAAQYGAGAHRNTGTTGTGLTGQYDTAGPHSSNLANKADPRVDSDLDGSRNAGAASYGTGAHHTGTTGSGLTGTHNTGDYGKSTAGPHSSNLANKLDPRVDSDNDGSRNVGAAQHGAGAHQTHGTGLTGGYGANTGTGLTGGYGSNTSSGLTGSHGTGGYGSTNTGPHDSSLLNKADPRVDSDRDGSRNAGASQYGPGAHHTHGTTGTGLTGATGTHGTHHGHTGGLGSGPAPTTAGPHKSDMLNKADPRVDSDRDGSRTVGQEPAPQY